MFEECDLLVAQHQRLVLRRARDEKSGGARLEIVAQPDARTPLGRCCSRSSLQLWDRRANRAGPKTGVPYRFSWEAVNRNSGVQKAPQEVRPAGQVPITLRYDANRLTSVERTGSGSSRRTSMVYDGVYARHPSRIFQQVSSNQIVSTVIQNGAEGFAVSVGLVNGIPTRATLRRR